MMRKGRRMAHHSAPAPAGDTDSPTAAVAYSAAASWARCAPNIWPLSAIKSSP